MCMIAKGRNLNRMNRTNDPLELQKNFLDEFDGKLVNIIMVNGYQMKCFVNDHDGDIMIVTRPGETPQQDVQSMIFKHAISTIEPIR